MQTFRFLSPGRALRSALATSRRYILAGFLTIIPLWVTWLVVDALVHVTAAWGKPLLNAIGEWIEPHSPKAFEIISNDYFKTVAAVIVVIGALYMLGWLTTDIIGRKIIALLESLVERIPIVKTIYGSARRLLAVLREKPENIERVVLIDFPSPEMKTVGLVTRTFTDSDTGLELAAVYVPTTPNPTSGYLEIVPVDRITPTNWSVDEAMTFVISGGAVVPKTIHYERRNQPTSGTENT